MADSLEMPIDGVRVLLDEYPADRWGRGGQPVGLAPPNAERPPDPVAQATAKLLSN
jgi:4-oxalocrotonate tautomerase